MTRHLAIGDIHGCFTALQTLSDYVGFREDDVIITLGDVVDKGPNTAAVLDWLIYMAQQHTLIPIRGNHDIMMLGVRERPESYEGWLGMGGAETLKSYAPFEGDRGRITDVPDHHWEFLEQRLVPSFETDTHFFVHGGVFPDMSLDEQPDFMLYWEKFHDPPQHQSGKIMVCGHTSQKDGMPAKNDHAVCIDTWACGRGWLSCLHVESGTIWQANEVGDTRTLHLDELD